MDLLVATGLSVRAARALFSAQLGCKKLCICRIRPWGQGISSPSRPTGKVRNGASGAWEEGGWAPLGGMPAVIAASEAGPARHAAHLQLSLCLPVRGAPPSTGAERDAPSTRHSSQPCRRPRHGFLPARSWADWLLSPGAAPACLFLAQWWSRAQPQVHAPPSSTRLGGRHVAKEQTGQGQGKTTGTKDPSTNLIVALDSWNRLFGTWPSSCPGSAAFLPLGSRSESAGGTAVPPKAWCGMWPLTTGCTSRSNC
ncbi:uncharacterized protein B0I36DRAFT_5029 [Microdochium trichocladiopsis]|uniref:Uncharacterized protein n=1 Tax=Microdochium trichocladiopsis TaxID=1682393 RepID=A0A9P8YE06_9PEZI|nr:uncharacterized protein B0I36DRAFT_5029 [Microdochium trichocladiopsis]KAH7040067.1 hypothetical protein B0I36DRAFT_5029 [Microdochium trichocladiopsis]